MKVESLQDLLEQELRDLYDAEKQLVKALPKMAKGATSPELKDAIQQHLEQTKEQVTRIEQVFHLLGAKAKSKPCAGMKGLIEEGQETLGEDMEENCMDAAIIGAAQRVEHYEMAGYGTARAFAEALGLQDVAELLQETLEEEKAADEKLTQIAESLLEEMAKAQETSGEEMEASEDSSMGASQKKQPGRVKKETRTMTGRAR